MVKDLILSKFIRVIFASAFILFYAVDASAQFTVPTVRPDRRDIPGPADSMRTIRLKTDNFTSRAREQALRKERRKQRNTVELNSSLQLTQTQFDNWAQGGDNTFQGRATIMFRHQHKRSRLGLDYKFEARYGVNYISDKSFKNEDEFKFNFSTSWDIHNNWSYSGVMNIRSQFSPGHRSRTDNTRVSKFMAPGFFDVAVGFAYKKNPWNIVISPIGGSATFVLDRELSERGINGVPQGDREKWQVGPSVKINYDRKFAKDVLRVRSEAYSFTNIKTSPTLRWETWIDVKPTRFLTTSLYANMVYDKAVTTKVQFKYSIGVGLAYNFKNK